MGGDDDGPSDEEASGPQPTHQPQYSQFSPRTHDDDNDEGEGVASPPPPPPPPMPAAQTSKRRGDDNDKKSSPRYPTTIEVLTSRSRIASRARQKIHAQDDYSQSFNDTEASIGERSRGAGVEAGGGGIHQTDQTDKNYESFPGTAGTSSVNDESQQPSLEQTSAPSLQSSKKARGQVLVHYHPQLGDEGYESTLLDQTVPADEKYTRVNRAMNVATGNTSKLRVGSTGPPKHITAHPMHSRAIDDIREEEELRHSPRRVKEQMNMVGGENDEYNNAATRQIRRRVFRVALERGMQHEARKKKLLDADMDVGGPSLMVSTTQKKKEDGAPHTVNNDVVSPLGLTSPVGAAANGYKTLLPTGGTTAKSISSASYLNEGDMPLTPKTPGRATDDDDDDATSAEKVKSPPSPPSHPPSYRTIVQNLIASNEPQKLAQIDRVMEKYAGREEELIKKLDLRYRRRRAKMEKVTPILEDLKSAERSRGSAGNDEVEKKDKDVAVAGKDQQPMSVKKTGTFDSKDPDRPLSAAEMKALTAPEKITFLKVDPAQDTKDRNAILAMQSWGSSWDRDEEPLDWDVTRSPGTPGGAAVPPPPPQITKKPLPAAISDSTKTDVHGNVADDLGEGDDNNSGFIGIPNVAKKADGDTAEVPTMEKKESVENLEEKDTFETNASSPIKLTDAYNLKSTPSYGDGISVITMETKDTLAKNRAAAASQQRGPDGEPIYSFDDMLKRPPNSITVEDNSGSGGMQQTHPLTGKPDADKIQRIVPEVESVDEKAKAAEVLRETVAKLDDVEARIRARRQLREEEAKSKHQEAAALVAEANDTDAAVEEEGTKTPDMGNDRPQKESAADQQMMIESILSSFDEGDTQEASFVGKGVEQEMVIDEGEEEAEAAGEVDNRTISTIGSAHQSVAEKAIADATRAELQRQKEVAEFTSAAGTNEHLEEEIACLIAEKESRVQAEKAVALRKAQQELEAERKARVEAEAARVKAEEELERLRRLESGKTAQEEEAGEEKEHDVPSPPEAEAVVDLATVTEDEEETSPTRVERLKSEAELSRLKAEQDLERLKLEKMAELMQGGLEGMKSTEPPEDATKVDDLKVLASQKSGCSYRGCINDAEEGGLCKKHRAKMDQNETAKEVSEVDASTLESGNDVPHILGQDHGTLSTLQTYPEVNDHARLEAEAARLNAEMELERLKLQRRESEEKELAEQMKMTAKGNEQVDEVEEFRQRYSSDDEDDHDDINNIPQKPQDQMPIKAPTQPGVEKDDEQSDQQEAEGTLKAVSNDDDTDREQDLPESTSPPVSPPVVVRSEEDGNEHTPPVEDVDEEAQIHQIARVTFEGDQSKGQLSFTAGSKVEAHSNQRGPWWLGRCGGRTGWFPASAVVPASEYLASVMNNDSSPSSDIVEQDDEGEEAAELTGEELNAAYEFIRNPSDDPVVEEGDDSDSDASPAKNRWLDDGAAKVVGQISRDHSPPPNRLDPSEMAGLSERLYHDEESQDAATAAAVVLQQPEENELVAPKEIQPQSQASSPPSSPPKAKPTPGWRAAKDPNSGLIYYYHTGTRETTWVKPPDFEDSRSPVMGSPRKEDTRKDKSKRGGRGVRGFLSKMKKAKHETSPASAKKGELTAVGKADSPKEAVKPQAQVIKGQAEEVPKNEPGLKATPDTESPQGDWKALDDEESSSSDGSEDSEFTWTDKPKEKLKTSVRKLASKIKLKRPMSPNNHPYDKFVDGAEEDEVPQELPAEAEEPMLASEEEEPKSHVLPGDSLSHQHVSAQEADAHIYLDETGRVASSKAIVSEDEGMGPEKEEPKTEYPSHLDPSVPPSMSAVAAAVALSPSRRKKTEWRSAIDAATGREYYYIKGSQKVTWEKPTDL